LGKLSGSTRVRFWLSFALQTLASARPKCGSYRTFGRAVTAGGRRADVLWTGPSGELEAATRRTDRPSPDAPAASGTKAFVSTGWPGATSDPWFGAVNPSASTGLGNVGIPPGTQIGP
jgi:hypothetical protein